VIAPESNASAPGQTWSGASEPETGRAVEWVDFVARHGNAHLVSAKIEPLRTANHLRRLRKLLTRTIEQAHPASAFATTIVRLDGTLEIQCGFAETCDADKLRRLVRARHAPRRAGWSSHHSFTLDAVNEQSLAGGLEPRNRKGRNVLTAG